MYANPGTARGNVTQLRRYADAVAATGGATDTAAYDNLGNVLTQSSGCCQQMAYTFTAATKFAYPTTVVRGDTTGAQLTTSATYDFNTGLVRTATDVNAQVTTYQHEAETLRPEIITSPDTSQTTIIYEDNLVTNPSTGRMNTFVKTQDEITDAMTVIDYTYRDGRGAVTRVFKDDVRGSTANSTDARRAPATSMWGN
ncbi:MAG: hypothetical protein WKF30_16555 [Pyrinomonadaceae bacterium]